MLVKAVAQGAAAHDLSRFFSPEIARQINTAEQEIIAGVAEPQDIVILGEWSVYLRQAHMDCRPASEHAENKQNCPTWQNGIFKPQILATS